MRQKDQHKPNGSMAAHKMMILLTPRVMLSQSGLEELDRDCPLLNSQEIYRGGLIFTVLAYSLYLLT